MLTESKHERTLFKQNQIRLTEMREHFEGCGHSPRSIPIDMCNCDCYVKRIFYLGIRTQKKLSNPPAKPSESATQRAIAIVASLLTLLDQIEVSGDASLAEQRFDVMKHFGDVTITSAGGSSAKN